MRAIARVKNVYNVLDVDNYPEEYDDVEFFEEQKKSMFSFFE